MIQQQNQFEIPSGQNFMNCKNQWMKNWPGGRKWAITNL